MRNDGSSRKMYQVCSWEATMPDVDIVPASRKTAANDNAIAISYEITCAVERRPPSSGYVEPDAQPASTMP